MTSTPKPWSRLAAIAVLIILIAVCFFISFKKIFKKPALLPQAQASVNGYVDAHLSFRSSMSINGLDILEWLDGRPKNMCSVLAQQYTPLVEGRDIVDGVECKSIRLKPNLKLRPWIQFWIDPKSGNVLYAREWSAENHRKSVGIGINARLSPSGTAITSIKDKRILQDLSEGYRLIGYLSQNPAVRHYVYSDGLQVVSVFVGQSNAVPKIRLNTVFEQGITRVYARESAGCRIVCIADLPASVLTQWAEEFITQQ